MLVRYGSWRTNNISVRKICCHGYHERIYRESCKEQRRRILILKKVYSTRTICLCANRRQQRTRAHARAYGRTASHTPSAVVLCTSTESPVHVSDLLKNLVSQLTTILFSEQFLKMIFHLLSMIDKVEVQGSGLTTYPSAILHH